MCCDKTSGYRVKGFTSAASERTDFPPGTLIEIVRGENLERVLSVFQELNENLFYGPYEHSFIVRSDGAVAMIIEHRVKYDVGTFSR